MGRRNGSIAALIERFQVKPSTVKHDSYGVYDLLDERFVVPYVLADNPEEAWDLAWKLKDEQDSLHEEGRMLKV